MKNLAIRESLLQDRPSLMTLYADVFREDDLLPLVGELLQKSPPVLSLVGTIDKTVVANVIFTVCSVAKKTTTESRQVALLGPFAVATDKQRQGTGRALVSAGLARLKQSGTTQVYVLGDPAIYGRLGFMPEVKVNPPYSLPDEWESAWQSIILSDVPSSALTSGNGVLDVPPPWNDASLWLP